MKVGDKEEGAARRVAQLRRWRRMAQSLQTVTCDPPTRAVAPPPGLLIVQVVLLAVAHDVGRTEYNGIIVRGHSPSVVVHQSQPISSLPFWITHDTASHGAWERSSLSLRPHTSPFEVHTPGSIRARGRHIEAYTIEFRRCLRLSDFSEAASSLSAPASLRCSADPPLRVLSSTPASEKLFCRTSVFVVFPADEVHSVVIIIDSPFANCRLIGGSSTVDLSCLRK